MHPPGTLCPKKPGGPKSSSGNTSAVEVHCLVQEDSIIKTCAPSWVLGSRCCLWSGMLACVWRPLPRRLRTTVPRIGILRPLRTHWLCTLRLRWLRVMMRWRKQNALQRPRTTQQGIVSTGFRKFMILPGSMMLHPGNKTATVINVA